RHRVWRCRGRRMAASSGGMGTRRDSSAPPCLSPRSPCAEPVSVQQRVNLGPGLLQGEAPPPGRWQMAVLAAQPDHLAGPGGSKVHAGIQRPEPLPARLGWLFGRVLAPPSAEYWTHLAILDLCGSAQLWPPPAFLAARVWPSLAAPPGRSSSASPAGA